MLNIVTHLYRITSVLYVAAVATPCFSATVCGASPKRTRVVLRLCSCSRGLATKEVLLGWARARRLCGRKPSGPTSFQVGAHLIEKKEGRQCGRHQMIALSHSTIMTHFKERISSACLPDWASVWYGRWETRRQSRGVFEWLYYYLKT